MRQPKPYLLATQSGFINPHWINSHAGASFESEVGQDGLIDAKGDKLRFSREALPAGTRVRVTLGRNFTCCTLEDWATAQAEYAIEQQRQDEDRRAKLNSLRVEAEAFNATIKVPVKWDVGIKDVLSGLSANSNGDGRNRSTVQHILLHEDLHDGRLQRKKNDFLCSSNGDNGKRWSDSPVERVVDGDGKCYAPKVTCKKCIQVATRWMKET